MMTIDFRIRPPFKSFTQLNIFQGPFPPMDQRLDGYPAGHGRDYTPSYIHTDMGKFMDEMDRAGIRLGVFMGRRTGNPVYGDVDNAEIEELCNTYPGRFVGFGGINPHEAGAVEEVRKCAARGFKGIGIDAGWCAPELKVDDPLLMPIYEEAAKHGLIASITMSAFLGSTIEFSEPATLQRVANRFPEMDIVVPHGCWPHVSEAFGVALMCRNVHLMPDTYLYVPKFPQAHDWVDACNSGFLKYKMLFASSYPIRGLEETVRNWKALPFEQDPLFHSLYYNAARLLKL